MRDAPQLVHTYLFTQCGLRRVLNGSSHNKKLTRKVGFLLRVSCPNTKVTFLLPLGYRNTRPRALNLPKYPEFGLRDLVGAEANSYDLIVPTFSKRLAR
jgi:hypothetical protein